MSFDREAAIQKADEVFRAAQSRQQQADAEARRKSEQAEATRQQRLKTMNETFDPTLEGMRNFLSERGFKDVSLKKSEKNQSNPNASLSWKAFGQGVTHREMTVTANNDNWAFKTDGGPAAKIPYDLLPEEIEEKLWTAFRGLIG